MCGVSISRSGTARSAGGGCRADTPCRPPTRWVRPAYSSAPASSASWSKCTPRWASRWRRSPTCCATRSTSTSTPGGLARLLHRAARDATPAYQELCEQVRNAPVVTPDETGWRVGGGRHWLWAYATADTTVYAICPGRGFDDAATVLGTDYAGVLVRDGWQVYRCYKDSLHQSCVNHYADIRIMPMSARTPPLKAVSGPRLSA